MTKLEVEQHIIETTAKVEKQKALVASLETQALEVAAQGDVKKVVAAKKELAAARELLDGYELVLKTYQMKAVEFQEKREPEALKIRQRLAGELWPSAVLLYDQVKGIQAELGPVLEKITQLNDEMLGLANQHKALIGDKIYTPRIPIPQELYLAANAKLDSLPKSLDVRLPAERESDHVANQMKEQKPIISKILKHMNIETPVCPTCGSELLAQRYKLANDESNGYASLRCPKHVDQWMDIAFPARSSPPGARYPIPEGPVPLGDIRGSVPSIPSHGLAETPGLTNQNKGGKKAT